MAQETMPVVQAIGLTKHFRDFWHRKRVVAVDHLDFNIQRNEVFGLLGPNGSGKTTTIKMLLGLLYPTRGRISILGHAPTDVAIKSRIGYLPEESYLYRFLDARETLDYYGRLFQIPRQERKRRVEQLLEMVGLTRQSRRRVGEYSKGMARRIGLAQALINDPDLLILDEPTTGLDPIGTREIKDLIIRLKDKGKTILLCSHLLADVEDVCQRVTVLYGGKCQAVGTVQDLLTRQNLTQITTGRLSEETIARIKALIEQEMDHQPVEVTQPTDRLENFFLRIVRQAQEAQQVTSGVTSGGRIAEFLETAPEQSEAVIESLVAAGRHPTAEEQAAAAPTTPEPVEEQEVIEELIQPGKERPEPPPAEPGTEPVQRRSPQEPESPEDRTVIDSLLGQQEQQNEPDHENKNHERDS